MILVFYSVFLLVFGDIPCDNIPELNRKIISYTRSQIGKKVDRGECWDLAARALDIAGASWDHNLNFGKKIDHRKDCVYPGDIIQFENVEIEFREGNSIFTMDLDHHTAIIYEVKSKGNFKIAEQNTSMHGRKVSIDALNLEHIKKGKVQIYRPEK